MEVLQWGYCSGQRQWEAEEPSIVYLAHQYNGRLLGQWRVTHGQWPVANEQWQMGSGQLPMGSEEWLASSGWALLTATPVPHLQLPITATVHLPLATRHSPLVTAHSIGQLVNWSNG